MQDWNWEKEVQSQILRQIDKISCQLVNMFRKKGKPEVHPQELLQPEYVKAAKRELVDKEKAQRKFSEEEVADIEKFWKRKNPKATFLGGE